MIVRLDVARDGQVLAYEIAGSSGEQVLDRAVMKSVAGIGRLPALEEGDKSYSFTVPMSFRLADAKVAHDTDQVEAWQNRVRRTVASNLAYTDKMAAEGVEGRVKVRLTLATDGRVLGRELQESSGNETLDAEVLHLAGRIDRLPGLPAGEDGASIVLPLNYRLADAR